MLVYADAEAVSALKIRPNLEHDATVRIASFLFPGEKLEEIAQGDLSHTCPPGNEINIGHFPGVTVVAAKEFGIDYPSKLPQYFLKALPSRNVYLHAMHSTVDWFAFAQWS